MLRADGAVVPVGAVGTLLGILREVEVSETTVRLRPGDSLTLYTDGAHRGPGDRRRVRRPSAEAVGSFLRGAQRRGQRGRLEEEILAYQGGISRDDLAVLVLATGPAARLTNPG